jgi:Fe-S cluster assembly protein SufD
LVDSTQTGTLADPRPALSAAELAALSDHLEESTASREARLQACDAYLAAALPDRVYHLWRFTDPTTLLPASLAAPVLAGADVTVANLPAVEGAAATVDLWPGRAPSVAIAASQDISKFEIGALAQGTDMGTRSGARPDHSLLFNLMNEAGWNAGLEIKVAAGAELTGPIYVRIHATGGAMLPRLKVTVGTGAKATIVEEHTGGEDGTAVVGTTSLHAEAGAHVRHVVLQTWDNAGRGFLKIRSRADRDADLLTVFGSFGGARAKVEMTTDLAGPGSRSEMIGVALGAGKQRCDLHTGHNHIGRNTWSNIDFKAVMGGQARSSYTGLIRIEETARNTEAFQTNRNLLLTPKAHADAIPELEILTEEVSCSHGATVAPVDPEQLFYLQSRGLSPDEAIGLVVRGFLENTLRSLPAVLRPAVEQVVESRLEALEEEV